MHTDVQKEERSCKISCNNCLHQEEKKWIQEKKRNEISLQTKRNSKFKRLKAGLDGKLQDKKIGYIFKKKEENTKLEKYLIYKILLENVGNMLTILLDPFVEMQKIGIEVVIFDKEKIP